MLIDKIKLGFIGCGGIVEAHLNHGLKDFPDVDFVGWCDLNEETARKRREQAGGRGGIYTDAERMLEEAQPDAVFIMLPPFAHGPVEERVLERNLPFFIEKPVAIDLETAEKVGREVETRNLVTAVGYMTRYRKSVQKVKELLSTQSPVLLHGGWILGGPKEYEGIWKWWVQKDKSGGQFLEQTTHTTDLARYLLGEVRSAYAVAANGRRARPDFFTIEDASMVQLQFENGAIANLYSSASTPVGEEISLTLWATEMKAAFKGWEHNVEIDTLDGRKIGIPGEENIFALEDRAFIDSIRAGRNLGILATYADGLAATRIACAANRSMETGEVIRLS
jgi:predicted dehydrogenase